MRVITDALPALIGYSKFTHHYRFVNKHYEALYGVKQRDIVGRHISEIIGEDLFEFTLPYRSAALGGEEVTFEDDFVDARKTPFL